MADVSVSRKRQRRPSSTPAEWDIAPASLFYSLILHIVAEAPSDIHSDDTDPAVDMSDANSELQLPSLAPGPIEPAASSIPTTYILAITRIDAPQSHLTASMALDLKSLLAVIQRHLALSPPAEHPLITQIASPASTDETPIALANTSDPGSAPSWPAEDRGQQTLRLRSLQPQQMTSHPTHGRKHLPRLALASPSPTAATECARNPQLICGSSLRWSAGSRRLPL